MKEENKYYIPEIEEFHVGFEYQQKYFIQQTNSTVVEWRDKIIDRPNQITIIEQILRDVKMDGSQLSVKYLDKEDIESLGWKSLSTNKYEIYSDKVQLKYFDEIARLELYVDYDNCDDSTRIEILYQPDTLFKGTIKNKSELKTLMKWLNIV